MIFYTFFDTIKAEIVVLVIMVNSPFYFIKVKPDQVHSMFELCSDEIVNGISCHYHQGGLIPW